MVVVFFSVCMQKIIREQRFLVPTTNIAPKRLPKASGRHRGLEGSRKKRSEKSGTKKAKKKNSARKRKVAKMMINL